MNISHHLNNHKRIQMAIVAACGKLGIEAIQEYRGKGWRADVYVPNYGQPLAFEIQLSPQTLKRTLERQSNYAKDGIKACWLFENPVAKLITERPDLPLFYVEDENDLHLLVNLGNRRKIDLATFLEHYISNNIQFKSTAITKKKQLVRLVFYEMSCWKCHAVNHLYYVDTPFRSACNAEIKPEEALWESSSIEYTPEIIALVEKFIEQSNDSDLKLAQIKKRFSKTVGHAYTSFGCYKCDSIFGDFFVMDAKMDMMYGPQDLTYIGEIELQDSLSLPIPHWCFPDNNQFCL